MTEVPIEAGVETAVLVVWWIIIIAALILTVVATALLIRVVRVANKIESLAKQILPAAVGIVNNTAAIKNLEMTNTTAGGILSMAKSIAKASSSIDLRVSAIAKTLGGNGRQV